MQLLDELGQEHRLVDEVAGSLVRFSQRAAEGDIEPSDVADFVRFFRVFVAGFHHQREEETLFPALVDRAEKFAVGDLSGTALKKTGGCDGKVTVPTGFLGCLVRLAGRKENLGFLIKGILPATTPGPLSLGDVLAHHWLRDFEEADFLS